ncbi:hypothetical protein WJX72_000839 [[Myrmecia] bisecta]|uniref:Abnormal spindle-like microcephaly-associated protein ASH domain-containing protein n=1 Tax=[Myrmecia] bisecta TaxID=41462 RepID=A0AAW1PVZ2_9CHLO
MAQLARGGRVTFRPIKREAYSDYIEFSSGSSTFVVPIKALLPTVDLALTGIGKFPFLALEQTRLDFGDVLVGEAAEQLVRLSNHSAVPTTFTVEAQPGEPSDVVFQVIPARGMLAPEEHVLLKVVYTPQATGTFSYECLSVAAPAGNKVALTLSGNALAPAITLSTPSINFGSMESGKALSRVLYIENKSDIPVYFQLVADAAGVFTFDRVRGSVPPLTSVHVTIAFTPREASNYWKRVTCLIKDGEPLLVDLIGCCFSEKTHPPPLSQRHINDYLTKQGLRTPWEGLFDGTDSIHAVTVDASEVDFGACSRLRAGEYKTLTVHNRTGVKMSAFVSIPTWRDPASADPPATVFQAFPEQADIRPHGSVTFRLAFRPPKDGQYYNQLVDVVAFVKAMRNFRLVSEEDLCPPWTLPVLVVGNTFLHRNEEFETKAELSKSHVAFPPCRPHETVYQTLMVMNHGDTAFQFEIVGAGLHPRFSCKPRRGVVSPKSWQLVALRFQADSVGRFSALAKCVINSSQANALPLALHGTVSVPALALDAGSTLFFKPTCIGATSVRSLMLRNTSRIPVAFQWAVPQRWQRCFLVSPISGILRGNERTEVRWRFAPDVQKEVECRVACLVAGALPTPSGLQPGSFAEEDRLGLRLVGEGTMGALTLEPSSLDMGTVAVGFPVHHTITMINQSDGNLRYAMRCVEEAFGPPPVCAALTAFATYPTVLVTDVACAGIAKPFVWSQMSCALMNEELLAELSELPPVLLDLGKATLQSEPRVVHFELSNPGALPVEWDIQGQNDVGPGVEMENWVEHSRPRNEAERLRDFIVDNRIFEILPRNGRLAPGERTRMTVTYRPLALGPHALAMLLSIRNGKQIRLQLSGATVPEDTVALSLKERTFTLAPVPISDSQPPLQTYTLRNGGPASLTYSIDCAPFRHMTEDNYDFEVLTLRSPATGVIPCGGAAQLNILFQPLEAKLYSLEVPVRLGSGETKMIRIAGRGYHPSSPAIPAPTLGERRRDRALQAGFAAEARLQIDGQLARVSHEVVSFGMLPNQAISRRLVLLTSCALFPINFCWDHGCFRAAAGGSADPNANPGVIDGRLSMSPASGQLLPGETCVVKLTFTGGMQAQLFEGEVRLTFTPSVNAAAYLATSRTSLSSRAPTSSTVQPGSAGSLLQEEASEIILEDPLPSSYKSGTAASQRLPVHLSTTHSSRCMLEPLQRTHLRSMERFAVRDRQQTEPAPVPQPQVVVVTLEGRVLRAEQLTSGHYALPSEQASGSGGQAAAAFWTPPAYGPLPGADADVSLQGGELADVAAVLADLLADALREDEVAEAFANLPPEEVPYWAEIRDSELPPASPSTSQESDQANASGCRANSGPEEPVDPTSSEPSKPSMPGSENGAAVATTSDPSPEVDPPVTSGSGMTAAADATEAVLKQPEFQAFAEFVLESAIYGMIQESALGDWSMA